jgi:hypothetical protein
MIMTLMVGIMAASIDVEIALPDYDTARQNGHVMLEPGVPMLPYHPVRVLVPFGEKVERVSVKLLDQQMFRYGAEIDYARIQQPISSSLPDLTQRDPMIWNADRPYPEVDHQFLGSQFYRGYQVAVINIYPYKYNPVGKQLFSASGAIVHIETTYDSQQALRQANFTRLDISTRDQLRDFVVNPDIATSYSQAASLRNHTPSSRLIDLSVPREMVIITDATRAPWFADYVQWNIDRGINTAVFLTSDIYTSYTGVDNAAKVRAFIADAYQTWAASSSPLEYVILGGDDEIVPERGCYGQVGDTVDQRMPVDIYFSNLDGDWNANGNNIFGEILDNVDMLPEVHIGRFPAETAGEFANIFNKIMYYVDYASFSNNIAIMFGENLNNNPLTWGGDYKDDVATHIPESYFMRRHYQRDNTYNADIVWNAINQGANVMNHMGHANETYLMGQGNNTIEQLENTEYGFLYSQGCYPAAFDQRTSGDGECIGEHLVTASGALFSFIGNTRYGWYMPGGINGASQYYDRQYFIGFYETLNTELGKALTYSRLQNLNAAMSNDVMRWCYYEVVLFGDPSISVKYPDPFLPLLTLEDYTITDEDGDNDGSLNPGEMLRLYPRVRNHQDWAPAYDVSVRLEGVPAGVQVLGPCISIAQLPAGQLSDPNLYISFQLPQAMTYGSYSMKLVVDALHPQTGLSIGERKFTVSYDITLIDNRFPWDCQNNSKTAPIVYDFNADGDMEIMYLDVFGQAYLIGNDGDQYSGFMPPSEQNVMRSTAMGDLTGDGNMTLVVASRTGNVYGTLLAGAPLFNYQTDTQFLFTPVIADIDGDGMNEVLAHSLDKKVWAFENNGTLVAGFPVLLPAAFQSEMAAADLDGNGAMDILVGTTGGELYAIGGGGNVLAGYPVNVGGPITGSPLVLENNRVAVGAGNNLVVLEPNGNILFNKPLSAGIVSGAVPADLNRDGASEIVFNTVDGALCVVDQAGNYLPGFPVAINAYFTCPPIIADLDDDLHLEILLHSYVNSIYAINHDGTTVPGFPFGTTFNGSTPATLLDFDDDNMLRLVTGYSTGVLVVNLRRPETIRMPWTTYRGSLLRQGSYASTGYVANDDAIGQVPVALNLRNYPNPFNPSTSIAFDKAKAGRAKLSVYNVKGQFVKVLLDTELAIGTHNVVWDGKDSTGNTAASGIYLYRLETEGKVSTQRMLMLK